MTGVSRRQRPPANLARTFDLAQAMVRRLDGSVLYCTSGLCKLYGWPPEEMLGRCSHELLATRFPKPLADINAELLRNGQWTGELRHRKRDGSTVWVASHWALTGGRTPTVSEVNNDITELKRIQEELRTSRRLLVESRDRQRALSGRLLTAQDDERRRIAQDLHDDLCQKLAILAFDARNLAIGCLQPELSDRIESLQNRIVRVSQDVRNVAYRLHPSVVDDLGLSAALQSLCDEFSQNGARVTFAQQGRAEEVPLAGASCLYRVAQEALANAARHSRARQVTVELTVTRHRAQLVVADFGGGFDPAAVKAGLGLAGMQERAARAGGELSISSRPGRGARIKLVLPIPGRRTASAARAAG